METENGDSKSKMEDYSGIQQIGRGAFGAAFLVLHKTENKKYVLKKIRLPKQIDKFKNKECQEMSLIEKLRHPYIVEYKDAWVEKGNCICIVTEYCEVGNISEILRKARGTYFSEEKLCKWLTQLLLAIDYLHSNRLLHGNLKLSNIFVTKENNIRLGDFGLAKILNEEGLAPSFATSSYTCPELLADSPYGYKSDIWSLGCCMFEIAAHQQAFRAPDMAGLINKINRSLISPLPIVYSSTLKQIIKSMLRKSPEHRPTAAELLRHSHLQPFLLRCDNPSTVFLPVKSPSPNNAKEKEKSRKPSPSSNGGAKNYKEREVEVKQRELLPLFEESTNMEYPSLLDGDAVIEDELETKRVDPTSFSRNTSEDSESLCTSETTACNGDNQDDNDSSATKESIYVTNGLILPTEDQEKYSVKHTELDKNEREREETIDADTLCSPHITEETNLKAEDTTLETLEKCMKTTMPDTVCDDNVASRCDENTFSTKDKGTSEIDPKQDESTGECSGVSSDGMQTEEDENSPVKGTVKIKEDISTDPIQAVRDEIRLIMNNQEPSDSQLLDTRAAIGSDESKDDGGIPGELKADALESLLELCARLLKQDKFDELSGVLKPFGDDAVSSRETAIWLTKSLMNAQNLAKKS